jgi:hypothetical protein
LINGIESAKPAAVLEQRSKKECCKYIDKIVSIVTLVPISLAPLLKELVSST